MDLSSIILVLAVIVFALFSFNLSDENSKRRKRRNITSMLGAFLFACLIASPAHAQVFRSRISPSSSPCANGNCPQSQSSVQVSVQSAPVEAQPKFIVETSKAVAVQSAPMQTYTVNEFRSSPGVMAIERPQGPFARFFARLRGR